MQLFRIREIHREKMAEIENEFLRQKHSLQRSLESALWELEERQLSEKHQLIAQQFRVLFLSPQNNLIFNEQKILLISLGCFPTAKSAHAYTT